MAIALYMSEDVINQAIRWGFSCNQDSECNWQISSPEDTERWQLKFVDERWILIIGGVAQIRCHPAEAIAFLERRQTP